MLEEKARSARLEQQLTRNGLYEVEVKTGGMKVSGHSLSSNRGM